MLQIGQIVYSKCGHDKGLPFIIYAMDGEYVYLVDGERRPLAKPKRKKQKHIQITHCIDYNIKEKLENKLYILDSEIRKTLVHHRSRLEYS